MKASCLTEFQILFERSGLKPAQLASLVECNSATVYRWRKGRNRPSALVLNFLKNWIDTGKPVVNGKHSFTFIDLFAGIGGMRRGFEAAGGKCVYTCEWNAYARKTYLENFPATDDHRLGYDITEVNPGDIPEHDILLAGFPCQPFSIAGVSKKNSLGRPHGFMCETQGTLFFEIEKILDALKPPAFLLENVKNLERHDRGNTFRVIRETLEQLGYTIDWQVIDAKGFVPQHRERIFIAGFRKDTGFRFADLDIPLAENGPRLSSILHPQDGSEPAEEPYTEGPGGTVAPKYTLTPHLWNYLQAYAEKHRVKGNGFGFGLFGPEDTARTLSARYYKDGSEILIRQPGKRPRRLTPRECARLRGFDGPGESRFVIPVSDTQAYKQFGNSVAVPVIKFLAERMLPFILKARDPFPKPQLELPIPGPGKARRVIAV